MASSSFSSSITMVSQDSDRPDLESIKELVTIVNEYLFEFLACSESWNALKFHCISKINIRKQEFFEFSEHSVLSNLYWGIETLESAIEEKCAEDKMGKLQNSEKLLQAPAMLDEDGVTAGIQNSYLICCSYFYLSLARKLQNDESQVALHFLQAIIVSPTTVRKELAPKLCADLFSSKMGSDNEGIREISRRNKNWLMYYQVMLYGQTPQWQCRSRNGSFRSDQLQSFRKEIKSNEYAISSIGEGQFSKPYKDEKVHPFDLREDIDYVAAEKSMICREIRDESKASQHFDKCTSIRCLQEVLIESQSDTSTSTNSCCSYYVEEEEENEEENMDDTEISITTTAEDDLQPENRDRMVQAPCFTVNQICTMMVLPPVPQRTAKKVNEAKISNFSSGRFCSSISDFDLSIMEVRNKKRLNDLYMNSGTGKDSVSNTELMTILEKAITKLCFPEGLAKCEEDYAVELTAIYKMLNNKKEMKYTILKDIILDQLLTAISSSEEEKVRRASMSILISIVSVNKSAVEYIRNKGLKLCDLATALKQNVHEAAILIYLINPPPTEIKTLELLPTLMEIVCTSNSYKEKVASEFLTPPGASLMIVEILVTAFDSDTNNMHLAAINSPRTISRMLDVARDHNVEECISMTNILIKCMQFDGQSRKFIMQLATFAPFKRLLQSTDKRAKFTALQFFHEFLCMPRSSTISLLQWIRKEGSDDIMQILLQCVQQLQPDYQLLAANLLLQLDILFSNFRRKIHLEKAHS